MKRVSTWLALLLVSTSFAVAAGDCPEIRVCFTPPGGCIDTIVTELNRAKKSVLVQAYTFSSKPIADALVNAQKRGVQVQAILDKGQRKDRYTEAGTLTKAGIRTLIDPQHAIAHNKVMIIDGEVVITGSLNFTRSVEERNAENLLVIKDKATAEKYTQNWHDHEKHSEPY
ncbi:MAG TPA: phospholipase D family protein [Verrucomicrobiae bacterium]|nr:phospholipase D family protein [Verrucomicrobiae bacterium]